jgi:hypothetical protein
MQTVLENNAGKHLEKQVSSSHTILHGPILICTPCA